MIFALLLGFFAQANFTKTVTEHGVSAGTYMVIDKVVIHKRMGFTKVHYSLYKDKAYYLANPNDANKQMIVRFNKIHFISESALEDEVLKKARFSGGTKDL